MVQDEPEFGKQIFQIIIFCPTPAVQHDLAEAVGQMLYYVDGKYVAAISRNGSYMSMEIYLTLSSSLWRIV